ncbi:MULTISPECIES: 3-keto-5-aminohexanoate cleavage protein [unclassified Jeotgalibaca]|uniref:3-keto-5-aminohexanoate cleavage protein n=1 Tax=unclassified Jeotgalibaca TaxID=2621505 RepID=UPI003FD38A16
MTGQKKTIITVALSGSQGSKEKNPHTPVTVDEMIEDAYHCYLAGASIVHIHVKADDCITYEINNEKFQQVKEGIERRCDMIVNLTTSGEVKTFQGLEIMGELDGYQNKRLGILDLEPEMATFDMATMNFGEKVFLNPLTFLRTSGRKMKDLKILPEVEIFNIGDIQMAQQLIKEGALPENPYYQLCLGVSGGTPATIRNLVFLQEALPAGSTWSALGIGIDHLPILFTTVAMGGHVRVGLEDNLYYTRGQKATNVALVKRAARIINEFGNVVASPMEARKILGIRI